MAMVDPRLRVQCAIAALLCGSSLLLAGCGGGGGGVTTTATTTTMTTTSTTSTITTTSTKLPYSCKTDTLLDSSLQSMASKGMAMDDTTMSTCPDKILGVWPNTKSEKVRFLRLFAAWKTAWGDDAKRTASWKTTLDFINTNNVKVLLGVDTKADHAENEKQFQWGLDLMKQMDKDKILGFSFGNEMLNKGGIDWTGYMTSWVPAKIKEMDAAGFENVKITLIWSMGVLPRISGKNFPFIDHMYKAYKDRWVWGVNPYSIWDVSQQPTSAADCHAKTDASVANGYLRGVMTAFRKAVTSYTGNADAPIWIGETGWSSPFTTSLRHLSFCPYFASKEALKKYYQMFLEWDGSLNEGLTGPEVMFYFTNRDAKDGGDPQPFGLVDTCSSTNCKIQAADLRAPLVHSSQETTSVELNETFAKKQHSWSPGDGAIDLVI